MKTILKKMMTKKNSKKEIILRKIIKKRDAKSVFFYFDSYGIIDITAIEVIGVLKG